TEHCAVAPADEVRHRRGDLGAERNALRCHEGDPALAGEEPAMRLELRLQQLASCSERLALVTLQALLDVLESCIETAPPARAIGRIALIGCDIRGQHPAARECLLNFPELFEGQHSPLLPYGSAPTGWSEPRTRRRGRRPPRAIGTSHTVPACDVLIRVSHRRSVGAAGQSAPPA